MASLRDFSVVSVFLLAAPLTAVAVGCSSSDETLPTGPTYTYPTQADFCRAIAAAECSDQMIEGCYGVDITDTANLEANRTKCVDVRRQLAACNPSSFPYDPANADACVASRKSIYADGELTRAEVEADAEACLAVFSRGGVAGAACSTDVDCDTGAELRCIRKPGAAAGICNIPREVGGGADCDEADATCADGFYCDGDSQACLQLREAGDACNAGVICGDDLLCNGATATEDGVCEAKLGNLAECASDEQCIGFCVRDDRADEFGQCVSKKEFESTSDTCVAFQP